MFKCHLDKNYVLEKDILYTYIYPVISIHWRLQKFINSYLYIYIYISRLYKYIYIYVFIRYKGDS